ncbi:MAG: RNA methyltransferase [Fibrobacteres bacterium]|nr:RNA methyltransferase [Fibrobacterota bacterium]
MLSLVLVGPELAVNVGFTARAMACFGIGDLRIVGSPGIATDGAARKTGKSALDILEAARYFPSLDLAIADCGAAYGFTRRARDPAQRIEDLAASSAAWRSAPGSRPSALVFGRESHGLTKEETLLLTHLVRIPMPAETLSLNLSHAVAIVLYAFVGDGLPTAAIAANAKPVAAARLGTEGGLAAEGALPARGQDAATLEQVLQRLESIGFFKGGKQDAQREHVRLLWQRLRPDARELDFLSGLLKSLLPRER